MDDRRVHGKPTAGEPLAGCGVFVPRQAWGREAKDYLARASQLLFARHEAGASGRAIVEAYTGVVDHVVTALYEAACEDYAARYTVLDQRAALVAQGGYGRGELNLIQVRDRLESRLGDRSARFGVAIDNAGYGVSYHPVAEQRDEEPAEDGDEMERRLPAPQNRQEVEHEQGSADTPSRSGHCLGGYH